MIIQVHHWYNDIVRNIFAALDTVVLRIFSYLIKLIFNIAFFSPSTFSELNGLYSKIYVVLTIYMLFKLTFTFLNYIINPEALSDQKQGVGKIIRNSIIMIILLIILPGIFNGSILGRTTSNGKDNLITRIQKAGIPLLTKIILTSEDGSVDQSQSESQGIIGYDDPDENQDNENYLPNKIAISIAKIFMHPAEETYKHVCTNKKMETDAPEIKSIDDILNYSTLTCKKKNPNGVGTKYKDKNFYKYSYVLFISTIVIGFIDYMLVRMSIVVGKRTFKLIILEIIFPIPVIMLIDPQAMESADSPFNSWLHTFISTFLDLFFHLGVLFLFLTLISLLITEFNSNPTKYNGFSGLLLQLALIISLIAFASEAPTFVKKALGVKEDKSPSDELAGIIGAATGITLANGATKIKGGLAEKAIGAGKNAVNNAKNFANRGASLAAGIAGGAVNGITSRNGLRGVGSGINAGIKEGLGLDSSKGYGENAKEKISEKLSNTTVGKAYNEELERIKANAKADREKKINEASAAAAKGDISQLTQINGDSKDEVDSRIKSGSESIRNYAEAQAAKAKEEYNQANDKYLKAKDAAEKAKERGDKKEQKKFESEAKSYKADMDRAQLKIDANTKTADSIKERQNRLASNAERSLDSKDLVELNDGHELRDGQLLESYAEERADSAKNKMARASGELKAASRNYNEAIANGDLDNAAIFAGEMQKQQSIIDENREIYEVNKNVADTIVNEKLRNGNYETLANRNENKDAAERIKNGEMTAQSYAASKAEEAKMEISDADQRMKDAETRETLALSRGDTSAAADARAEYNKLLEIKETAQNTYDINKGFADTVESKQRDLAESARNGNMADLIELNEGNGSAERATTDSLKNPDNLISYTQGQISDYDAKKAELEVKYQDAVDRQSKATTTSEINANAAEAKQYLTEIEEIERKREANETAYLSALSAKSGEGDLSAFLELTEADAATKAAMAMPGSNPKEYARKMASTYQKQESDYAKEEAKIEQYIKENRSSLNEEQLSKARTNLEDIKTKRSQNKLRQTASQKYASRL